MWAGQAKKSKKSNQTALKATKNGKVQSGSRIFVIFPNFPCSQEFVPCIFCLFAPKEPFERQKTLQKCPQSHGTSKRSFRMGLRATKSHEKYLQTNEYEDNLKISHNFPLLPSSSMENKKNVKSFFCLFYVCFYHSEKKIVCGDKKIQFHGISAAKKNEKKKFLRFLFESEFFAILFCHHEIAETIEIII